MEFQAAGVFGSITNNITVEANTIFRGPRAGIVYNDLYGGNHVTRLNIMFDLVMVTHDHGPYNVWDRQQWMLPQGFTSIKNVVESNVIIGNWNGPKNVDLDDGARDHIVRHNLLYRGHIKFKGSDHEAYENFIVAVEGSQNSCLVIVESHKVFPSYAFYRNKCFAYPAKRFLLYSWENIGGMHFKAPLWMSFRSPNRSEPGLGGFVEIRPLRFILEGMATTRW